MINDDGEGSGGARGRGSGPADDEATVREVAVALRRFAGQLRRTLRPVRDAQHSVPLAQEAVVGILVREGAQTVAQLARLERIRPQSMSTTVAALIDQGLAERSADPADGRRMLITLTAEGIDLIENSRQAREKLLADRLEARLTPRERRTVASALALLAKIVDD